MIIRTLELDGKPTVTIEMTSPQPSGDDWSCHWKITGLDVPDAEFTAYGEDPMSAIIYALGTFGLNIELSPQKDQLTYLGSKDLRLLSMSNEEPGFLTIIGKFPTSAER